MTVDAAIDLVALRALRDKWTAQYKEANDPIVRVAWAAIHTATLVLEQPTNEGFLRQFEEAAKKLREMDPEA